jgi:hypothetical protein
MYKISDFKDEIGRRTLMLFSNHLFFIFFCIFVVILGTFGIWVTPVLIDDTFTWTELLNQFTALSLISFSLPLLVILIFDKIVTLAIKGKVEDAALTVWFCILFIIALLVISFLFILGYKNSTGFTWYGFFAWFLVLYIWILANVDNPNYQKPDEPNSASGGKEVKKSMLKDGN